MCLNNTFDLNKNCYKFDNIAKINKVGKEILLVSKKNLALEDLLKILNVWPEN